MRYALNNCMEIDNGDGTVTYSGPCYCGCDKEYSVTVPFNTKARWKSGEHIQNILPDMPKHDREFLISGITHECWERMFAQ